MTQITFQPDFYHKSYFSLEIPLLLKYLHTQKLLIHIYVLSQTIFTLKNVKTFFMKSSIIFLKNCMVWLSEMSVSIYEVKKIRNKLKQVISSLASADDRERAIIIMQKVDLTLKKFLDTETRIIHTIKKNDNFPDQIYVPYSETKFAVKNEEYLVKVMHYHHTGFVELQRMVNEFLKRAQKMADIKNHGLPTSITTCVEEADNL